MYKLGDFRRPKSCLSIISFIPKKSVNLALSWHIKCMLTFVYECNETIKFQLSRVNLLFSSTARTNWCPFSDYLHVSFAVIKCDEWDTNFVRLFVLSRSWKIKQTSIWRLVSGVTIGNWIISTNNCDHMSGRIHLQWGSMKPTVYILIDPYFMLWSRPQYCIVMFMALCW